MTERRLVLHVGPHKTGTTAIQLSLDGARDALAGAGVLYGPGANHLPIVDALRTRPRPGAQPVAPDVLRRLVDHDLVLLSAEDFVNLDREELSRVRTMFPDRAVTVVFYLRSMVRLLPSHWTETVKHGVPDPLHEYLEVVDRRWTEVLPHRQITKLGEVFGRDAIRLVDYETAVGSGGVVDALLEHGVGVDPSVVTVAGRSANASLGPAATEFIRVLNARFRDGSAPPTRAYSAVAPHLGAGDAPGFPAFAREFSTVSEDVVLRGDSGIARREADAVRRDFGDLVVNADWSTERGVDSSTTTVLPRGWAPDADLAATLLEAARALGVRR